jgi:hypothetical protein
MRSSRQALALAGLAFATVLAPGAQANGRFPRAQRLLERGGDPQKLVLAATYGILLTSDRGAEWRHICELGFAFQNAEIDPVLGVFSDESMIVRGSRSLNRAETPYCAFSPVLGTKGSDTVADFSLDASDADRVVALVMERGDASVAVNRLYESLDAGRTFAPFGEPLPATDVSFGITLDLAPSDPARVYATALAEDAASVFVRSDDSGRSWSTVALPLEQSEYPYIAAVDATNANAVYVRTDFWSSVEGVYQANDALFYSDDGGASFREVFRQPAKLLGFALSPDASEVLVGYGDPVDPGRFVDSTALGIYRASTTDFAFTKIHAGSVSCLAWTRTGLYVCTPQDERGFALGFAPNAEFDLGVDDPFTPLLDLRTVSGPVDCSPCTSSGACRESWATTCALFGSCAVGVGGSGAVDTDCAGAGGASSGGGASGTGAASNAGAEGKRPRREKDASCGCRSLPGDTETTPFLSALGLVVVLLRRARRGASRAETSRLRRRRSTTIKIRRFFQDWPWFSCRLRGVCLRRRFRLERRGRRDVWLGRRGIGGRRKR